MSRQRTSSVTRNGLADHRPRIHVWRSEHKMRPGIYFSHGPNGQPRYIGSEVEVGPGAAMDAALEELSWPPEGAVIIWEGTRS